MSWTAINQFQKCGWHNDTARSESDSEPAEDLNNQLHIDASASGPYFVGEGAGVRQVTTTMDGEEAIEAMRKHLDSLLPEQLIQDAYGVPVLITAVSPQHLAKLQAKVWCDLPKMVAGISNNIEAKVTDQDIVTAQAVSWLSTRMSQNNGVFVLQPNSKKGCQFALCGSLYATIGASHSQMVVTVEPLVDWMTLEPAHDVTTIWTNLYRRNKKLLFKYSLSNSKFLPANPLRICLRCLHHLADSRNEVWRVVKGNPDILSIEGVSPWREDEQEKQPGEYPGVSLSYTNGPMANRNGFDLKCRT